MGIERLHISHTGPPLSIAETDLLNKLTIPLGKRAEKQKKNLTFFLSARTKAVFLKKGLVNFTVKEFRSYHPAVFSGVRTAGTTRGYGRFNGDVEKFYNWEDYAIGQNRFNEMSNWTFPAPGISGEFSHEEYDLFYGDLYAERITNLPYLELVSNVHTHFLSNDSDYGQGDLTFKYLHAIALINNACTADTKIGIRLPHYNSSLEYDPSAYIEWPFTSMLSAVTGTPTSSVPSAYHNVPFTKDDMLHLPTGDNGITFSISELLEVLRSVTDETINVPSLINISFDFDVSIDAVSTFFVVTETYPDTIYVPLVNDTMDITRVDIDGRTGLAIIRLTYQSKNYWVHGRPLQYILVSSEEGRTPEEIAAIQASTDMFPPVEGDIIKLKVVQGFLSTLNSSWIGNILMDVNRAVVTRALFSGTYNTSFSDPIFDGIPVPAQIASLSYVGYRATLTSGLMSYTGSETDAQPCGDNFCWTNIGGSNYAVEMYQLTPAGVVPYGSNELYTETSGVLSGYLDSDGTFVSINMFWGNVVTTTQLVAGRRANVDDFPLHFSASYSSPIPESDNIYQALSYSITGEMYRYDIRATHLGGGATLSKFDTPGDPIAALSRGDYSYTGSGAGGGMRYPLTPDQRSRARGSEEFVYNNNTTLVTVGGGGGSPVIGQSGVSHLQLSRLYGNSFAYRQSTTDYDAQYDKVADSDGFIPHVRELKGFVTYTTSSIPNTIHLIDQNGNEIGRATVFLSSIFSALNEYINAIVSVFNIIRGNTDPAFVSHMEAGNSYASFVPSLDENDEYEYKLTVAEEALMAVASDKKTTLDALLQTQLLYNDFASYYILWLIAGGRGTSYNIYLDIYFFIDTNTEILGDSTGIIGG